MHVTGGAPTVTAGTFLRMGRTRTAARPAAGRLPSPAGVVGRVLAAALASIALLLSGAVDVLPRSAAGPLAPTSAGAAQAPAARTGAAEAPSATVGVRAAGLAAVPAPTGPGGGLPPSAGPLVAPHLLADPQSRPPTPALPTTPAGTPGSRAPPGPAGT